MNNNKIDGPDYYRLADGTFLEDALWEYYCGEHNCGMSPPIWDACVYLHRAGHKDGEPFTKDISKAAHYIEFLSKKTGYSTFSVMKAVCHVLEDIYEKHGNPWQKGEEVE